MKTRLTTAAIAAAVAAPAGASAAPRIKYVAGHARTAAKVHSGTARPTGRPYLRCACVEGIKI
jgi:hypothetical protein